MESSHSNGGGGGGSPPPFLIKTYEMVEDPATNLVVSWGPGGASFVVWNPLDFSRDLLPKFFKHNNFSSFIRQLNTYGFRKIDPERWEFANEEFIRGHTHLLKNIHRRKPVHSHSLQSQINGPLAESERRELEDEINRLKYEKSVLLADLQRQAQQQGLIDWQMQSLEGRLMAMEQRQKNIVASLCEILQGRGFVSSTMLEADHFSKKRRAPKIDFFVEDPAVEEQQHEVLQLQRIGRETPGMFPVHHVNDEQPFGKMELTLVSLEKFFQRANCASSEDMYQGATELNPAVNPGEMSTVPMEIGINLQPSASLHPTSPTTGHNHVSTELAESPSFAESPTLPMTGIHEETNERAEVDICSEIASTDTSQDGTTETEVSHVPETVNDQFWERFLTETPHTCSAESDRQDVCGANKEKFEEKDNVKIGLDCNYFHHRNNVDQIIEQMGHLASAENV